MVLFPCHACKTPLQADDERAGQLVRCPTCKAAVRVPDGQNIRTAVAAGSAPSPPLPPPPPPRQTFRPPPSFGGVVGTGRRYGFNCKYCSSRLEATDAIAAQEGQCPTCGSTIVIPIQDRYGRLIDPVTQEILKQDPHPVHAYAAAGERAPRIIRAATGHQQIVCPRCNAHSPITANNCKACGMPFTMEGTTVDATGSSNNWAVASLVLGILGLPATCMILPSVLAIVFGGVALAQLSKDEAEVKAGRGMAIAGIMLGVAGLGLAILVMR